MQDRLEYIICLNECEKEISAWIFYVKAPVKKGAIEKTKKEPACWAAYQVCLQPIVPGLVK
jgi:hypothetical protein